MEGWQALGDFDPLAGWLGLGAPNPSAGWLGLSYSNFSTSRLGLDGINPWGSRGVMQKLYVIASIELTQWHLPQFHSLFLDGGPDKTTKGASGISEGRCTLVASSPPMPSPALSPKPLAALALALNNVHDSTKAKTLEAKLLKGD